MLDRTHRQEIDRPSEPARPPEPARERDAGRGEPRTPPSRRAHAFFERVADRSLGILCLTIVAVVAAGFFLPTLRKDTRSDAFIPPGSEALLRREQVREVFGLSDPLVVAVVADPGQSVFTPAGLALVRELTAVLETTPGVDAARVTSLATEDDIVGSEGGLEVRPFLEEAPATQAEADAVRAAVQGLALHRGSLVSEDGRATVVVAEIDADADGGAVYAAVHERTLGLAVPDGLRLHVAGEGGVTGHLGHYIDADARRMVPLAFVLIGVMLSRAYRTPRGLALPLVVVAGGTVVAVGSMAALGVPWYLITTALPVILVAIGVADGIHVLGQYYVEAARDPDASQRTLVVRAMHAMWRPVTITSLTDCAGFLALALASDMPPMRAFGVFAAIGVLATWAFSLLALPAVLVRLPRRASRVAVTDARRARSGFPFRGVAVRGLEAVGRQVVGRPRLVLAGAACLAAAGVLGATAVEVDYERIRNFRPEEPIHRADRAINAHLDGSNYLDVMFVADEPGGLLEPGALARVAAFQRAVEALPHVRGSTSLVDYVRQMHWAYSGERPGADVVPDTREAVAQLLLLYDMQSDPDALERIVDFERRRANVRVFLDTGRYSAAAETVTAAEAWLDDALAGSGLAAHLAGRVNVDYHWMRGVARSHFVSVALALVAVLVVSAVLFRSLVAGLLTTLPVSVAVLGIYAFMAAAGLWLGITTAMFAAVAIGLGVDFSVHLVDRLRAATVEEGLSLETALARVFPDTGRALFFNFACCGIGFGVLASSRVPTLVEFGLLTGVAVAGSFLASMAIVPALVALIRPRFFGCGGDESAADARVRTRSAHPARAAALLLIGPGARGRGRRMVDE